VTAALMRPNQVLLLYRYDHENLMLKQLFAAAEEIKRKYIKVQTELKNAIATNYRVSTRKNVELKATTKNVYYKPKSETPPEIFLPTVPTYSQIVASSSPSQSLCTTQVSAVAPSKISSPLFTPKIISDKFSSNIISAKKPPEVISEIKSVISPVYERPATFSESGSKSSTVAEIATPIISTPIPAKIPSIKSNQDILFENNPAFKKFCDDIIAGVELKSNKSTNPSSGSSSDSEGTSLSKSKRKSKPSSSQVPKMSSLEKHWLQLIDEGYNLDALAQGPKLKNGYPRNGPCSDSSNFYIVWHGDKKGIYISLESCQKSTKGVKKTILYQISWACHRCF
jgi:hypothetical protein